MSRVLDIRDLVRVSGMSSWVWRGIEVVKVNSCTGAVIELYNRARCLGVT